MGLGTEHLISAINTSESISIKIELIGKNLAADVVNHHYYIDSEETTFNFQRVSSVDCLTSADNITWDNASVPAETDFVYNLKYSFNGREWRVLASSLTENFIALGDPRLTTTFEDAGDYDIKVKTTLNKQKTIYSNQNTIFTSANFGNAKTITKLEAPSAPTLSAIDEDQANILISWDAVTNAERQSSCCT